MAIHIDEFLYRGRPEGSAEPPAWHLRLVSTSVDDFGLPTRSEKMLNMAQAAEAGWDLPEIIRTINAGLMVEVEEKRAAIEGYEAVVAEKDAEIARLAELAKQLGAEAEPIESAEEVPREL